MPLMVLKPQPTVAFVSDGRKYERCVTEMLHVHIKLRVDTYLIIFHQSIETCLDVFKAACTVRICVVTF